MGIPFLTFTFNGNTLALYVFLFYFKCMVIVLKPIGKPKVVDEGVAWAKVIGLFFFCKVNVCDTSQVSTCETFGS